MKRIQGHANRGQAFEELINMANAQYQRQGSACVHKVPTEFLPLRDAYGRICNCKVEHKSCVDYLGRYKDIPVAIEAKHTAEKRIEFSRVEHHQAAYLDDWSKQTRAAAIILVSFGMQDFYAIPWTFWREGLRSWQRSKGKQPIAVNACGWTWFTPGMASVSREQMHPDWKVNPLRGFILPYLDIVSRMKFCPRCQNEHIGAEDNFCIICGMKIKEASTI